MVQGWEKQQERAVLFALSPMLFFRGPQTPRNKFKVHVHHGICPLHGTGLWKALLLAVCCKVNLGISVTGRASIQGTAQQWCQA